MKKITLAIGFITVSCFISSVSAMDMNNSSNMKVSSDMMMKKDSLDMNKMSLQSLVKHFGYNWSKDRKRLAMMAGIKNYRGTAKQNLMIRSYLLSDPVMKEKMMKKDTLKTESDTLIKTEPSMMKKELGMYSPYSSTAVTSALEAGKTVYLFFSATWCPSCRSLDANITANIATLPENTIIFKVDYDNSTDLKKKYGVTMQHTVIKLNSDASLMKKILGAESIADIIK